MEICKGGELDGGSYQRGVVVVGIRKENEESAEVRRIKIGEDFSNEFDRKLSIIRVCPIESMRSLTDVESGCLQSCRDSVMNKEHTLF